MKPKLLIGAIGVVLSSATLAQALIDQSLARAFEESSGTPSKPLAISSEKQPVKEYIQPTQGTTVSHMLRSDKKSLSHDDKWVKPTKHVKKATGKKTHKRKHEKSKSRRSKSLK